MDLIKKIVAGHATLATLHGEVKALCSESGSAQCHGCPRARVCDGEIDRFLARLLDAATEQVRVESALIKIHQANSAHQAALAEHARCHDKLINDLGSYIMNFGRVPTASLVHATSTLLQHWLEDHIPQHDGLLFDIAHATTT